ncbi:hypothetical protein NG800_001475 [Epilithonimonas ginsengisoli]|uniref:Lipoprotein n=1 Tax=Epilithonimonas ginsengisoli TaxID=1245592 RepID=A0ABU4JDC5_9FLAO|nr:MULTISPECIES: hypothetical protein [Chryseobacterium group]MBV6878536.1 hypothetical protein [Epilithonimonas sp. FP105]MDW8547561.1 hypothetical protein [Epilithonimonas ginsengisoli]OAH75161.1 hypothetical protein AXA65_04100 [Chryseobacterium sp. FP211-J200]
MKKTHLLFGSIISFLSLLNCDNKKENTNGNQISSVAAKQVITKRPPIKQASISTEQAVKLAEKQFEEYLPKILDDYDARPDLQESHTGDFTGDGISDVVIYFSLAPQDGGNALVGQGLALYKNTGTNVKVIAGYEPNYLFTFEKISDGKIYVEKLEYAETDGRCCPSIRTEHVLKISGGKAY